MKFNRKTVTVIADDGRQWRVPAEILSPIKDVGPDSPLADRDPGHCG